MREACAEREVTASRRRYDRNTVRITLDGHGIVDTRDHDFALEVGETGAQQQPASNHQCNDQ
jgi:predicted transcriptional regulator